MEKEKFVLMRNTKGVLCRRYYDIMVTPEGKRVRKFYRAEKARLPERVKYRMEELLHPKTEEDLKKNKKTAIKFMAGTAALLVASGVMLGGVLASKNAQKNEPVRHESGYTMKADKDTNKTTKQEDKKLDLTKPPVVETYVNEFGDECFTHDSALSIAAYNYNGICREIEAYNKTASANKQIHFDTSKFDPALFVGAQQRESSLKTFGEDSSSHKGPFQIGSAALEDANKIAEKLYGKPVASSTDELLNPIVGSRACMYYYVYMYENLHTQLKGTGKEITSNMVIDSYLHGVGAIAGQVKRGEYSPKAYSRRIDAYADAYREYYNILKNATKNQNLSGELGKLKGQIRTIEKQSFSISNINEERE